MSNATYNRETVYQLAIEDITYFLKKAANSSSDLERQKHLQRADQTLSGLVTWQELESVREKPQ